LRLPRSTRDTGADNNTRRLGENRVQPLMNNNASYSIYYARQYRFQGSSTWLPALYVVSARRNRAKNIKCYTSFVLRNARRRRRRRRRVHRVTHQTHLLWEYARCRGGIHPDDTRRIASLRRAQNICERWILQCGIINPLRRLQ